MNLCDCLTNVGSEQGEVFEICGLKAWKVMLLV